MTADAVWQARLLRERAARKAAEQLLESKASELFRLNRELQVLAADLETRVAERTAELQTALAEADTAVKDREELANDLQAVIAAMPGVLIRVCELGDGSWRRTYVGPGIEEMTGYSVEEALSPEWVHENLPPAENGLVTGEVPWFSEHQFSVEFRFRHKKGHWVWIRRTARSHVVSDGRRETIAVWNDVTREKSLSEQLAQSAKLAQLGEVATGVAHELNQPLAAISLSAENALESLSDAGEPLPRVAQKLDRILQLVERATQVVDHMRIFGRIGSAAPQSVRLEDIIEGAETLMRSKMREAGVWLEYDWPADLPCLLVHSTPVEQVFMNLIGNSCDAYRQTMDPISEAARRIRIAASQAAKMVQITFTDWAGGIPEDVLPRVFEPFFTTKEVGSGTGLGLSISYGIITDMGGTITAENHADGCLVRILLPVAQ
ncbi:MAG: ATP-binding protein [Roseococcus sp.]